MTISVFAQSGTDVIDYTGSTGDKGSWTLTQLKTFNNAGLGSGTVQSAAMTVPTGLSVTGSPITTTGTFAVTNNLAAGFVSSAGVGGSFTSSATIPTTALSGTVTNAQLANSSVTIAGQTVNLGGTATVGFSNLTGSATVAQLPMGIPNANLANSSITINGTSTALGGTASVTLQSATTAGATSSVASTFTGGLSSTGATARSYQTVTATATLATASNYVKANAAASDITITLPAAPLDGQIITVKRINSTAGNTLIVPNSGHTLSTGTQVKLVNKDRICSFQYSTTGTVWEILD